MSKKGFTIIEMLVVLLFITLLSGIVAPSLTSQMDHAEESALKEDLYVMRKAIDDFYADHGRYPESLSDLVDSRYIRSIPVDPMTDSSLTWIGQPIDGQGMGSGIYDVRSGSDKLGSNGVEYSQW